MKYCSKCGTKNGDDSSVCSNCGLSFDSKTSQLAINNIIKIIVFFLISFLLDGIAIEYIEQLSSTNSNFDWILAFVLSIAQAGIYYVLLKPNLSSDEENYGITQLIVPTLHFIVLVGISLLFLRNYVLTNSINYLITAGVIIGAIHLFLRILKFQSTKNNISFGKAMINGPNQNDVDKAKEIDRENKMEEEIIPILQGIRDLPP